jgi:hypothetical protein
MQCSASGEIAHAAVTQLKGHLPEASRLLDGKMKKRKGLAAETGLFPGARTI